MRPDGDDLAVVVQAYQFDLLDPSGVIAASLLSASDAALFPPPLPATYNGLEMYHRDAATTDSSLRWSYGDAGNETVQLTGPAAVGAATANRPRVSLGRESGLPRTIAKIAAGQNTGGALVTQAAVTMESRPGPVYLTTIEAGQTAFGLRDDGQVNRLATLGDLEFFVSTSLIKKGFVGGEGNIYGLTFFGSAVAGVANFTLAGAVFVTINLPAPPTVANAVVIQFGSVINGVFASNGTLEVRIDGVAQAPSFPATAFAAGQKIGYTGVIQKAVSVAAHTITLVGICDVADNRIASVAGTTFMYCQYYR